MGRKKKKLMKPWCWYCNREFDDEKILVQHQKAKHFKCSICHKRLFTGPGLSIHCMQVHKETIDKVPNAIPGRTNIELEIYGMEGIPEADTKEHERQLNASGGKSRGASNTAGDSDSDDEGPSSSSSTPAPKPQATTAPAGIPPPGFVPMPMMPGIPPLPMGHMMPMGPALPGMMGMMRPPLLPMMPMPGMPPAPVPHGWPPAPPAPARPAAPVPPAAPAGAPPGPSRMLFPAAASVEVAARMPASTSAASEPPKEISTAAPLRPTFPAYSAPSSSSSEATASTTAVTSASTPVRKIEFAASSTSKLIHPDDDISLEELRAQMPKYKTPVKTSVSAPVPQPPGPQMPRPPAPGPQPPAGPRGMPPQPVNLPPRMPPHPYGMPPGPGMRPMYPGPMMGYAGNAVPPPMPPRPPMMPSYGARY